MSTCEIRPRFKLWIELITGYRQTPEYLTGLEQLYMRLREFSGPEVRVSQTEWSTDRKRQAERIKRQCAANCEFIDIAYSWGVGYGEVRRAKQLRKKGRKISKVFAIDGVHYSDWMPWRAIVSPLTSRIKFIGPPRINFPDNVLSVEYWTQNIDDWWMPKGHEITVDKSTKKVIFHGLVECDHSSIDEDLSIHDYIYAYIKQRHTQIIGQVA